MSINNLRYTWPQISADADSSKIYGININNNNLIIKYKGPKSECNENCIKKAWVKADIPRGLKIIAYACGSGTCGAYGLKGKQSDVNIVNGLNEIIVPWVTTLNNTNTCQSSLTKPQKMNTFLNSIDGCIKAWKGEKYISIGGWGEGYTFSQKIAKNNPVYIPSIKPVKGYKAPIDKVYACFNETNKLCESHPTNKLIGGNQNWGYWCKKGDFNTGVSGESQGAIPCDGGTVNENPLNCWPNVEKNNNIDSFINYAITNNYAGIDIDYEAGGDIGNQPYNGWFMHTISRKAFLKGLKVVHAPLNNFFFNNKNWTSVNYDFSDVDITYKTESSTGYYCEKSGGYGNLLYNLHKKGHDLQNIFIQFYNNPPGPCEIDGSDYCVTSGGIGSINTTPGRYFTIGKGCSGGASFNSGTNQSTTTNLLQCNYSDKIDKGWAWKNANYKYSGEPDQYPKMSGQYAGDPIGHYVLQDNEWLTTNSEEDYLWAIDSFSDNNNTKKIKIGGILNLILVMLLAKSYQPNTTISLGTVPPGGGNSSNLSTQMVKDIYQHLMGLQNQIDKDIEDGTKQSPVLLYLMKKLYNNGRLRVQGDDINYWNTYWGGHPTSNTFCTKYPGYYNPNSKGDPSKKLFGGIGAWSIYWTELTNSSNNSNEISTNWLDGIKNIFHANTININSKENENKCKISTPSTSKGVCVLNTTKQGIWGDCKGIHTEELCNNTNDCKGDSGWCCKWKEE